MSSVQQEGVDEHERCFEDPEEPFIPQDRRECIRVDWFVEMNTGSSEVFNCPINRPCTNQRRRTIQRNQRSL